MLTEPGGWTGGGTAGGQLGQAGCRCWSCWHCKGSHGLRVSSKKKTLNEAVKTLQVIYTFLMYFQRIWASPSSIAHPHLLLSSGGLCCPGLGETTSPFILLLLAEVQGRLWGTWGNGGRIEAKDYGSESAKFPCPDHPCRAWRGTVTSVVGAGELRDLWHLLWYLLEQRPPTPASSAFPGPRPGSQPSFALKYLGSSTVPWPALRPSPGCRQQMFTKFSELGISTSFLFFSYLLEGLSTAGEVSWGKGKKNPVSEGETPRLSHFIIFSETDR